MKILKALFLLPLFLLFWNISNANFDISNYEIKWDIKIDWTIDINEKIDANFYSQMHWIERILRRYYSVGNLEFQVFYDNIKVNNDNFTTYDEYWDTVVRIWDADKYVFGDHKYDIDYSMYWVIRNFSWMWYSELYWNPIWYDRDQVIKNSKVELALPKPYTWLSKEDFIISLWYTDYYNIDEFPWEISRDENKITIIYTWELSEYNWITLAIKFSNGYFEYNHEKQSQLFVWYVNDYDVENNKIYWVVHKSWSIDFKNTLDLIIYQPIEYFEWIIPYKFLYNSEYFLTLLSGLKINWKPFEYKDYGTEYYNQYFDLREFSWDDKLTAEYSMYGLVKPFTWEDENWTNKIYLPLPIFNLNEKSKNIELELEFPKDEFPDICSWIYREDIDIIVSDKKMNIDKFYDNWWILSCDNNILYFNGSWMFDKDVNFWISLPNIWFELNDEILWALEALWTWEDYYNDELNNRQSIAFFFWMILTCWWFTWFMNRRYSILWAKKQKYIVQYDAPKWMDSPEAWVIIDDVVDWKDITALIYQRAALKYIKIFSEIDNKKFYIKKLKSLPSSAKKYQVEFFNSLFKSSDEYHFIKDSDTLYKQVSKAKKWLTSYIDSEKWYVSKLDYVAWEKTAFKTTNKTYVWCSVFLWLVLYTCVVSAINSYLKPVWSWNILVCVLWIIFILFAYKSRDRAVYTDKWNELHNHCLWYKEFLMKVDKKKFEALTKEDPLFVEKALPYAVVFWVQTQFIKNITPEDISYFDWDLDSLLNSISYINKSVNYYPYSYSSSSYSWWGYSYSSSSWHSSWSSFGWWYSSWWWGGWWWGRGW